MSKTVTGQHTPGPLSLETTSTGILEVHDAAARVLVTVCPLDDGIDNKARGVEALANGHLFAAAPDLLEACQLLAAALDSPGYTKNSTDRDILDKARAAIAKANL